MTSETNPEFHDDNNTTQVNIYNKFWPIVWPPYVMSIYVLTVVTGPGKGGKFLISKSN